MSHGLTRYGYVVVVIVLLLSGILPFLASREARALTASPIRLELDGDAGSTVSSSFKLYNESNKGQTYYLLTQNFQTKDESGRPIFTIEPTGLSKWITIQSSVTIGAQERAEIPFSINIPTGTDPGGYFAGIFASTIAPEAQPETVSLESQVGTLVLLRVKGDFAEGANILEFKVKDNRSWFTSPPVDLYFRFQNTGDDRAKPLGDVIIKNSFGQKTKVIQANADGGNVLPKSIRRFELSWLDSSGKELQDIDAVRPEGPKPGFWNNVKYEWSHFALGRYTANLSLAYGSISDHSAQSSVSFWVIPWHLLLVALVVLAAIVAVVVVIVLLIVLIVMRQRKR